MILRLTAACAGVLAFLFALAPAEAKEALLTTLSIFDPRFLSDRAAFALKLGAVWSALDFALRIAANKAFATRFATPEGLTRNRRLWNACSAGLFLAATICADVGNGWEYQSLTKSFFNGYEYNAPSMLDYLKGRPVFENVSNDATTYGTLGIAALCLLLFCAIKSSVRLIRSRLDRTSPEPQAQESKSSGRVSARALKSVFNSPQQAFLLYLCAIDILVCAASFLNWATYRFYFIPISKLTTFHTFTSEGVWGACGAFLALVSLANAVALNSKGSK